MVHEFIIICNEVYIFQNTNTAFAKHRKIKKTCLQKRETFNQKDLKVLLTKKKKEKHSAPVNDENVGPSKKNKMTLQHCGVCGKTKHNAQTCPNDIESSRESKFD